MKNLNKKLTRLAKELLSEAVPLANNSNNITLGRMIPAAEDWANQINNFAIDNPEAKLAMDATPLLGQGLSIIDAAAHVINGNYSAAASDLTGLIPGWKPANSTVSLAKNKTILQKLLALTAARVNHAPTKALLNRAASTALNASTFVGKTALRHQDATASYVQSKLN